MTFEKLFMKYTLPVLMLEAAFTVIALFNSILGLVLGCIIFTATPLAYSVIYRGWLSTKQYEIKKRIIERAKAGEAGEEGANIMLKIIEDNGILIDY